MRTQVETTSTVGNVYRGGNRSEEFELNLTSSEFKPSSNGTLRAPRRHSLGSSHSILSKRFQLATKDFTLNKLDRKGMDLYDRDEQMAIMAQLYHETCTKGKHQQQEESSSTALVSIVGPLGSGKSSLAQTVCARIKRQSPPSCQPFVCHCKFFNDKSNNRRNHMTSKLQASPRSAVYTALSQLVDQILLSDNSEQILHDIRSAVSDEGALHLKEQLPRADRIFPNVTGTSNPNSSPIAINKVFSDEDDDMEEGKTIPLPKLSPTRSFHVSKKRPLPYLASIQRKRVDMDNLSRTNDGMAPPPLMTSKSTKMFGLTRTPSKTTLPPPTSVRRRERGGSQDFSGEAAFWDSRGSGSSTFARRASNLLKSKNGSSTNLLQPTTNGRHSKTDYDVSPTLSPSRVPIHRAIAQLLAAAAKPNHPLIITLTDMQWADQESLHILESLLTGEFVEIENFFVITTSQDVGSAQGFPNLLKRLGERDPLIDSRLTIEHIRLNDLDLQAVNSITSTVLRSTPEETLELAQVVHSKTNGNPLFVLQFLQTLVDDGELNFHFGILKWQWNLEEIRLRNSTDNVADFLKDKFQGYGARDQQVIQVAAYLGKPFRVDTLSFILGELASNAQAVAACVIDQCVEEGLMIWETDGKYASFVHEQIEEAARKLDPLGKPPQVPVRIGQLLLRQMLDDPTEDSEDQDDQHLFLVADLCNVQPNLVQSGYRIHVAQLNLKSGKLAQSTGAYAAAQKYFESGLECLGDDAWKTQLALTVELHNAAADACYCGGAFHAMEGHLSAVLDMSHLPIEDKIPAYQTRIRSDGSQHRFKAAVKTGLKALRLLGVLWLPTQVGKLRLWREFYKTKQLLQEHDEETLVNLPLIENSKIALAMGVLDVMAISVLSVSPLLHTVVDLIALQWTLKYGISKFSPHHFAGHAAFRSTYLGDKNGTLICVNVANALMERLDNYERCAKSDWAIMSLSLHYFFPMRDYIENALTSYKTGMGSGDVEFAFYCLWDHLNLKYYTAAESLESLLDEVKEACITMKQHNQETVYKMTSMTSAAITQLIQGFEAEALENPGLEDGNKFAQQVYNSWMVQLSYYFGRQIKPGDSSDVAVGYLASSRHLMFQGLIAVELAAKGKDKKKNLRLARRNVKRLQGWSGKGAVQCHHQATLLQAEIATLKNPKQATQWFRETIQRANRCGQLQDKALAHERSALFFLKHMKDEYWAQFHFQQAIDWYSNWGALAKVRQLQQQYNEVLEQDHSTRSVSCN